nr:hypothetical protein [uncultured Mediterraneibacter sp.]
MNGKKAAYGFRIALGGYLAFLGVSLIYQTINERPSNMVIMCICSVVFIVVGGAHAVFSIKKLLDFRKEERKEAEEQFEETDVNGETAGAASARQIDMNATVVKGVPDDENAAEIKKTDTEEKSEAESETEHEEEHGEESETEEAAEEVENDYEEK